MTTPLKIIFIIITTLLSIGWVLCGLCWFVFRAKDFSERAMYIRMTIFLIISTLLIVALNYEVYGV